RRCTTVGSDGTGSADYLTRGGEAGNPLSSHISIAADKATSCVLQLLPRDGLGAIVAFLTQLQQDGSGRMSAKSSPDGVPGGNNVLVQFEEQIAWVILNRPAKRNSMNPALNDEMVEVLDALELDDRCRVLVLTGAGDSFSAGMDLREFFRATDGLPYNKQTRVRRSGANWQWRQLLNFPKPTIAMVNGWCFGGPFTPLVSCAIAIAAEEATFGLSEINWGIIPGGVVTRAVLGSMNVRNSMYYILTGLPFDGKKAVEMGLVNEAVPKAQLRARTMELAKLLLAKNPNTL